MRKKYRKILCQMPVSHNPKTESNNTILVDLSTLNNEISSIERQLLIYKNKHSKLVSFRNFILDAAVISHSSVYTYPLDALSIRHLKFEKPVLINLP